MVLIGLRVGGRREGGGRREERGEGRVEPREREEGGTEAGRGRWCVGKRRGSSQAAGVPGVKSWNMTVS